MLAAEIDDTPILRPFHWRQPTPLLLGIEFAQRVLQRSEVRPGLGAAVCPESGLAHLPEHLVVAELADVRGVVGKLGYSLEPCGTAVSELNARRGEPWADQWGDKTERADQGGQVRQIVAEPGRQPTYQIRPIVPVERVGPVRAVGPLAPQAKLIRLERREASPSLVDELEQARAGNAGVGPGLPEHPGAVEGR